MIKNIIRKENLCLLLGLAISVVTFQYFLIPSGINIGGFAGISQILNSLWEIPFIVSTVGMNGLLYLWGARRKGYKFVVRSIFATMAFSALLDMLPVLDHQIYSIWITVLIAIIGAGFGFGLILSANASTGGSDLLAAIVTEHFPQISIGRAMVTANLIIICVTGFITGFVYGMELFIISIITTFFSNILIDFVYCLITHKLLPNKLQVLIAKMKVFGSKETINSTTVNPFTYIPKLGQIIVVEINGIKVTFQVTDIL